MTDQIKDIFSFTLPRTLFKKDFGFGIDYGSSVLKLAYTTIEGTNLVIHLVSFSLSNRQQCFTFLREICQGHLEPDDQCDVTGINIAPFIKELEDGLKIKAHFISEFLGLVDAFMFFTKNTDPEDYLHPADEEARASAFECAKLYAAIGNPTEDGIVPLGRATAYQYIDVPARLPTHRRVIYPLLLVVEGSGRYFFKVEESGQFMFIDTNPMGGRTLLGQGSIMLSAKSYEEIIELAARGDASKLDVTLGAAAADNDNQTYGAMKGCPYLLFSFGEPRIGEYNEQKFRREDLAAGLVSMVTAAAGRDAFNNSVLGKVQQVYFVGGVPSYTPLVRKQIETTFFQRCAANSYDHVADCMFVKGGAHMSAVGCLLRNMGAI